MIWPAPGRVVRDGADPLRRHRIGGTMDGEEGVEPMTFSPTSPCRVRLLHVWSWSRGSSPSTTRPAPVPPATAWGAAIFRPAKLIHDPGQSLASGAIRGWDKRSFYYFQMLRPWPSTTSSIWETPWEDLPAKTGGDPARLRVAPRSSSATKRSRRCCGAQASLRGSCTTWSGAIGRPSPTRCGKSWPKYIANKSCTSCGGSRLREEARHVFVDNRNLPAIAEQSIGDALAFFEGLNLTGQRAQIAERSSKRSSSGSASW